MRLTEEVNALLFEQADAWFSSEEDPEGELRAALANIAMLYDEHSVLLRAIVEVSTYDEEVAVFWRSTLGALRRRHRAAHRAGAGRRPRRSPANARATAFALVWMTERTLYQELVQEQPVAKRRARRRDGRDLAAQRLRPGRIGRRIAHETRSSGRIASNCPVSSRSSTSASISRSVTRRARRGAGGSRAGAGT